MHRWAWILAAALPLAQAPARAQDEPYVTAVWARVLFGPDGRVREQALLDEARYPAAFVELARGHVAQARIRPPTVDGQPVTLRTGVRLAYRVSPGGPGATGSTLRLESLSTGPIPLSTSYASYPKDLAGSPGWSGELSGVCRVGTDGRCASIEVRAVPGLPESARRFLRVSLEGWTFEPEQVDGRPVEGDFVLHLNLRTRDDRPEDFREDKFERLLRQR